MSEHRVNLSNKSDQELKDIISAVLYEQNLRRKLDASPEKIDQVVRQYQESSGVKDGDPWEYPTSSLLRPMKGALRTHDKKLWRSTIDHNVFEPGVSGWKLEPEIDPETGEEVPPPFVRPSGQHDAYDAGDRITWTDGEVYEAKRDGVDWDPGNAPGDWTLIESEPEPEPEPDPEPEEPPEDEEPEPEPEPEPGTIDNPFTWSGDAVDYQADQYVTFDGVLYRVQQDHESAAHWPPDQVAALYERSG